jgi:hypothetical protein
MTPSATSGDIPSVEVASEDDFQINDRSGSDKKFYWMKLKVRVVHRDINE